MTDLTDAVGAGLLTRFRAAGREISWRDERPGTRGGQTRIAHLHDEEARVLLRPDGSTVVDSGPVGALVLLLEIDAKGPPTALRARLADEVPGFGQGAIEAHWTGPPAGAAPPLPLADLVALARYALA
jgi:hypothetical protein